jgi:Domain of unknown function (DUF4440)
VDYRLKRFCRVVEQSVVVVTPRFGTEPGTFMHRHLSLFVPIAIFALMSAPLAAKEDSGTALPDTLLDTIAALDRDAFDAFNQCALPEQLRKHADFFAEDVEFYHDTGGVTWSRQAMLANTEKYVCGHFRRELIAGSLRVYPVKDFGAIAQGSHQFCQFDTGKCEGLADFTIVWRHDEVGWRITRVLSYGHRAQTAVLAPPTAPK